ncbi:hypothetical protein C1646_774090 [Rhizophagus diaphanus]|nr:hypothetical protein C1646_774090 [Rhizophagus diaphanus] [Rhizophagus sp. MUCL 43196]
MILLVKAHHEYYSQIPLISWMHGTEPYEHFFGVIRQINLDFSFAEIVQMLPIISQYTKALRNKKLNFKKGKSVHEARELAKFLGMIQPSTLLINNNIPIIFIDINNDENLHDNNESKLSDDCEIDLFTAINKASSKIQKINKQLEENLENEEIFNDCYSQFQLLDKMTVISILNGGDSIPNIEDANITYEFPLVKRHYVFVRYGDKMCIGRVISVYFEAYGKHCYTDEPVETINDISYISLHVYIPIHFNVFSDLVK